ncbi:MAG: Mov34/MPN/PAD-1 family protein [Candidatus Hodarchaeales archaeon]
MNKSIFISKVATKSILEIISSETVLEKVALVFGTLTEKTYFIEEVKEIKNLDQSSTSFRIKPEEMIREINNYEKKEKLLLGFFHTHPLGENVSPSNKDRYYMKLWPYPYIWIIGASKNSPRFKIFSLIDSKVKEITYEFS